MSFFKLFPLFLASFLAISMDFAVLAQKPYQDERPKDLFEDTTISNDSSATDSSVSQKASRASDSISRIKLAEKYRSINLRNREIYQIFPLSPDSLLDPYNLYPFHIKQADESSLSAVLGNNPWFTRIRTHLASNCNELLLYGIPLPLVSLSVDGSIIPLLDSQIHTTELYGLPEFFSGSVNPVGLLRIRTKPVAPLAMPEINMLWESGVFYENRLHIAFVRPLSRDLTIGIFSNYQNLRRTKYDHSSGNVVDFYKELYRFFSVDTNFVSDSGTSPETKEHIVGCRLVWNSGEGNETRLFYQYADLNNDVVRIWKKNQVADPIFYPEQRSYFSHFATVDFDNFFIANQLNLRTQLLFKNSLQLMTPLNQADSVPARREERLQFGAGLKPVYILSPNDTASARLYATRTSIDYQKNPNLDLYDGTGELEYKHLYKWNSLYGTITASGGYSIAKYSGQSPLHSLIWGAQTEAFLSNNRARFFMIQNRLPLINPLDSVVSAQKVDQPTSLYQIAGTELLHFRGKSRICVGFTALFLQDTTCYSSFWPEGIAPYKPPNIILTIAPSIGPLHGFVATTKWDFTDRQPYIKTKTTLSINTNPYEGNMHVTGELGIEYWSIRSPFASVNNELWRRQLCNTTIKCAVQIGSFRIFYTVDNLFNQSMAYLPGYPLPGLTFRWGFNWGLQG